MSLLHPTVKGHLQNVSEKARSLPISGQSLTNIFSDVEYVKVGNVWVTPHDTLRSKFQELDQDDDQKLDSDEMNQLCVELGLSADMVDQIIEHYDEDGDGVINFDEFCCMFYPDYAEYNVVPASPYNYHNPCISEQEEQELYDNDEQFIDSTFDVEAGLDDAKLVRAPEIVSTFAGRPKLFAGIDPHDINQGGLGDCWLLCALAAMAEYPGLIQSCFKNKSVSRTGKYEVKIWDGANWNGVVIDDLIPATTSVLFSPSPLYASPNRGELWVVLLEKALAKWVGGYANLDGGEDVCAWRLLIGRDDCKIVEKNNGVWTLHDLIFPDPKKITFDFGPPIVVNENDIWGIVLQWEMGNSLLGAATWSGEETGEKGFSGGEGMRADNIVIGHAYSVLQMVEFPEYSLKLIQLRNPWGNEQEWNGPWSDGSEEWDQYPAITDKLGIGDKDDGMFWMNFKDFLNIFERVSMCPHEMPMARRRQGMLTEGKDKVATPYRRADKVGPCGQPCATGPACCSLM